MPEHFVGPETGQHQDVGFADAGEGVVAAPGLEVPDPGPAQREPLGKTVCHVGEVDDERIVTRQAVGIGHRGSLWQGADRAPGSGADRGMQVARDQRGGDAGDHREGGQLHQPAQGSPAGERHERRRRVEPGETRVAAGELAPVLVP